MTNIAVYWAAPFILLGVAAHISVIVGYHYIQSPFLGAVAFVSTIYELYRFVSK